MKYWIYDTHAHTNLSPLFDSFDEIAKNCINEGIMFNVVGTNIKDSSIAIEQAKKYENIAAIIGIHPSDSNNLDSNSTFYELEKLFLENRKYILGFGETGLDYHYQNFNKDKQKEFFIKHINLSNKYNVPLIVHVRDAHNDCLEILQKHAENPSKILIHCFSSDATIVKKYIEQGYYISVPGIITFKKSFSLHEALKLIPLNKLLIETDCPWLSPEPNRGKINSPLNIKYIIQDVSNKLNIPLLQISKTIFENSLLFFNRK